MPHESRIIPDPIHTEVKLSVQLPTEATTLMTDLHNDRAEIRAGGLVVLACLVAVTLKRLFSRQVA